MEKCVMGKKAGGCPGWCGICRSRADESRGQGRRLKRN